jgi:hypothetical protein
MFCGKFFQAIFPTGAFLEVGCWRLDVPSLFVLFVTFYKRIFSPPHPCSSSVKLLFLRDLLWMLDDGARIFAQRVHLWWTLFSLETGTRGGKSRAKGKESGKEEAESDRYRHRAQDQRR